MKVTIRQEGFLSSDREAIIKDYTSTALLLHLVEPVILDDEECKYIVAEIRHEGTTFEDLVPGKTIICNVTAVSQNKADSENLMDLSWWRGGGATITDLVVC